jgi:hypothetical protein
MDLTYRKEILNAAFGARIKEVTEYQVNIDNFRLTIDRIGDDPQLQDFKVQIEGLLTSSIIEQRKAKIMLDVIAQQLEEQNVGKN